MTDLDKKPDFAGILVPPFVFVIFLWVISYVEWKYELRFHQYGLYPLTFSGLKGIILSPLVHADFYHLLSNSIPLLILGAMLMHFYKEIAYRVYFLIWILSGAAAWFFARPTFHIGASGIVYGLVCFLFFSGLLRRNVNLLALSLLVTFLYGGIVWGIIPLPNGLSWEMHLTGALSGFACALIFKKLGPQRTRYEFEDEEDDEGGDSQIVPEQVPASGTQAGQQPRITITFIPDNKKPGE